MRIRGWMAVLLALCAPVALTKAQSAFNAPGEPYVPRLGDIMSTIQSRHIKLWFAGKAANWQLADFELRQLKAALAEAASLYSGIPVSDVTMMTVPLGSVEDAIVAKDGKRFAKAAGELTDGCNACHRSMGRAFLVMRIPAEQPFADQVFAPQGSK